MSETREYDQSARLTARGGWEPPGRPGAAGRGAPGREATCRGKSFSGKAGPGRETQKRCDHPSLRPAGPPPFPQSRFQREGPFYIGDWARGPAAPAAVTVGSPAKPPVSKRNSLSPRLIPVDPAREKDALPLPKRDDDDRRHEKAARGDAGGWRQPGAFDQLYLVPRPKRTCTPPNAGMDGPGRDADGLRRSGEVPAREARPSGGARAAQGGGAPGPARGTTQPPQKKGRRKAGWGNAGAVGSAGSQEDSSSQVS